MTYNNRVRILTQKEISDNAALSKLAVWVSYFFIVYCLGVTLELAGLAAFDEFVAANLSFPGLFMLLVPAWFSTLYAKSNYPSEINSVNAFMSEKLESLRCKAIALNFNAGGEVYNQFIMDLKDTRGGLLTTTSELKELENLLNYLKWQEDINLETGGSVEC